MFKKGNQNQVTSKIEPEVSAKSYPVPITPRNWTEAMAAAAQHEVDQANKIHALEDELSRERNQRYLMEEANAIIKEDFHKFKEESKLEIEAIKRENALAMQRITAERDKYLAQFLAMYTHLRIGGNTIVEALEAAKIVVEKHEAENGELQKPQPFEAYIPAKHRAPEE